MAKADIWLLGFRNQRKSTVDRLQRAFAIDAGTAIEIEQSIPCAIRYGLTPAAAQPWVEALEEVGAIVELRAASPQPPGGFSLPAPGGHATSNAGLALDGPLELEKVQPRRRSRGPSQRPSMRSGATDARSARGGGDARGVVDRSSSNRMTHTLQGFGIAGAGAIVLGVANGVFGRSCFAGNATLFSLALDAIGLAALTVGTLYALGALLLNARGGLAAFPGAAALVLSYLAAFGINYAQGGGAFGLPIGDGVRNAAASADPHGPEARSWLSRDNARFQLGSHADALQLVETLYTAGASRVLISSEVSDGEARQALEVAVKLPPSHSQRLRVARAYRDFLGPEASSFAAHALEPPDQGWWLLDVSH